MENLNLTTKATTDFHPKGAYFYFQDQFLKRVSFRPLADISQNLQQIFFDLTKIKSVLFGELKIFIDYNLLNLSPFQEQVLKKTLTISPGSIASYQYISQRLNINSPRSVGQALKRNPLPIVLPCHRICGKSGHLTGFGSGLLWKKKLLELEQREIKGDFVVFSEKDKL